MKVKIIDLRENKVISEEVLALLMYKEGHHIIYCDIEGVAKMNKNDYYLLDECGNAVWIDTKKYKVSKDKVTHYKYNHQKKKSLIFCIVFL